MWFSKFIYHLIVNTELKWPSKTRSSLTGGTHRRAAGTYGCCEMGPNPGITMQNDVENDVKNPRGKRCENHGFTVYSRNMIYILGGFLWVIHIYVKLYRRVPSSCACLPNQHNLLHWQPAIFFPRREALCPCASRCWCWDVAVSLLLCQFPVWNSPWRKEASNHVKSVWLVVYLPPWKYESQWEGLDYPIYEMESKNMFQTNNQICLGCEILGNPMEKNGVLLLVGSASIYFKAMFCYGQRPPKWLVYEVHNAVTGSLTLEVNSSNAWRFHSHGNPPKWLVYEVHNGKSQFVQHSLQ